MGVHSELLDRLVAESVLAGPGQHHLRIESDQRRNVASLVAEGRGLADERRTLQHSLEVLRSDVLAACRDDQILLAIGDLEEAIFDLSDVSGVKPAVDDRQACRLFILVVTLHHVRRAVQHLTVLGDLHLDSDPCRSDGSEAVFVDTVHIGERGVLGHPDALEDEDPAGVEELSYLGVQRR